MLRTDEPRIRCGKSLRSVRLAGVPAPLSEVGNANRPSVAARCPPPLSTASRRSVCCAAMAREKYLDHLASVPLFSGFSTKELRDVAKATVELTLESGKEFVTQGEVGLDRKSVV